MCLAVLLHGGFVMSSIRCCLFVALIVALLLPSAAFAEGAVPTIGTTVVPWDYQLMPVFEAASAKYKVPLPLLLTLAHFGSGFENRGDAPTIEGGYGVMALRANDWGGDSLALAARLTNVSEQDLKTKANLNIMGAAAVLDYYATMWQVDRTKGLDAWLNVVITYAALDPDFSKMFAMEVYEKMMRGLDTVNSSGERFALPAQDIGSVDLASLEPPGVRTQAGYPGAIWYPAASCNYSAYYTAKDTVVVHTIEGTAAGCLSWFRNCNAQVSAHYVVSEAGKVYQCVDENYLAWHVSCMNSCSIGLEHEGYAASSSHPQALYDASALCVRDICNRWGIPKSRFHPSCTCCGSGICGHIDVTTCCCGTHTDPGNGWNWTYYISQIQGAPPAPTWAASYKAQSYPSTMTAGSTATAWVEYTNTGTGTWTHDNTRLGTTDPQDRSSPFYNAGNWISPNRPTDVDQSSVGPGAVGRFTFILKAPTTPGTYVEKYKPVQEGVTWFGDVITWTITVTAAKGNITGTVRNSYNNNPIAGATVAISGGPSTTTNSAGVYTFNDLDPATYTLNVSAANYSPTSGTATVTAGATTTKDFTLTSTDTTAPTAPSGLSATAVSPTQINLAWTASTDSGGAGLDRYIIYRGGAEIGRTTAVTYSDNGLTPQTSYSYYVKAIDNAGNVSAASNTASATTLPPTVPIFQDGFANTSYWSSIVQSPMPGPYPPALVSDHDHSQFPGANSLKTLTSDDPNQGCLIGHTFSPAFAAAKFESYFFDGSGLGYVGDFEESTEGWASYPSAYGELSTTTGGTSGNCLRILDHGWTGGFYKQFTSGFAAGESYTLKISTKVPTPGTWGTAPYVFVRFRDGSGATIGTDNTAAITADNTWRTYTLTGTVPSGAASVWIGEYMYLNATADYNCYVDDVSFVTSGSVSNNSRQGLQVRCHNSSGSLLAIYYLGTYSASPGSYSTYSAGYYKVCGSGCTGWYWPGAAAMTRTPGWHKFTIDIGPYTGAGNEVKFYIDDTQVGPAVERTLDTQTYGFDMVAYGYHYRVNQSGWFDDCAMYASAPVAPTIGTPVALSDTAIRWYLTDNSNNEMGFKFQDASQTTVATATVSNGTGGTVSADETGLTPNKAYTRFAKAYNGTLDSLPTASVTRWTLSRPPSASNVTCDKPVGYSNSPKFTFTSVGGFGTGTVAKYLWAWDTSPTHVWTGSEAVWNSGSLITTATSEGSWYLHVKGYNGENVANGTLDLGPYTFEDQPPTNPTSAVEIHGAPNGAWQSTISIPSFTWTGASDASGIAGYMVYFGPDETGESGTYQTAASYTSPAVETGKYYLRVRAKDNAGNLADEYATLFTFQFDASAPNAPEVFDDGDYSGSKTKLHAAWVASDAESGISEYQYAVGTSAGAADVVDWTSAGNATEAVITIPDPGMALGTTYFVSVKAKNGAGAWSQPGSADGIQLAPDAGTISAAKALENGMPVGLANKVVTASFDAGFYIEESDRTSGILVMGPGPNAGALATVGGVMGVNALGERAILDPAVITEAAPQSSRIPGPLYMTNWALGGSAFNAYTAGKEGGAGLNNVGLLVKAAGRVLTVDENGFTMTDGSACDPISVVTSQVAGVSVAEGDYVSVVGICSLELNPTLKPLIRVREAADVRKLN